ncbi:caspase-3-like isoform X2 [Watersipora subatra]|uniref:caspase-3-like isoform X2 n=1 Tax=Watersipora subatra TaxID=2589382 RepID=UPI00355C9751
MDADQRNIIQKNFVKLVQNLECSEDFLSHFVPKRILTMDMIESIQAGQTNGVKNRSFLTQIQKRGTIAFHVLYDALVATYQFEVADLLKPDQAPSRERGNLPVEEENQSLPSMTGLSVFSEGSTSVPSPEEVDQSSGRASESHPLADDDDSELSDSLAYFDESDESVDFISLRVAQCRKQKIRQLFFSDSVYKMTRPRGRCLIINNNKFDKPTASDQTELSNRMGSEMDGKNISTVFKRLEFIVEKIHEDLSAQEMINIIQKETEPNINNAFGMFVLIIMTHGTETELYGSDGRPVKRSKIMDLLTAYRFPAMAGKPKLLILQACSGGRTDPMGAYTHDSPSFSGDAQPPREVLVAPPTNPAKSTSAASGPFLASDDLFILRASFSSFVSTRHERQGTWFIRAIVEALYKHASHRDIKKLFEKQVMKKVRDKSIEVNRVRNLTGGQQPTLECFPTKNRKLYLFPGYNPPSGN